MKFHLVTKDEAQEKLGRFRRTSLAGKQVDLLMGKLNGLATSNCLISEELPLHEAARLAQLLRCHLTNAYTNRMLKQRVSIQQKVSDKNDHTVVLVFSNTSASKNKPWRIYGW